MTPNFLVFPSCYFHAQFLRQFNKRKVHALLTTAGKQLGIRQHEIG